MMCYRDRAFCADSDICANDNCSRKFTDKDKDLAEKWWGGSDYPVAVSPFKDTDSCDGYIPDTKQIVVFDEDGIVLETRDLIFRQEADRLVAGIGEPYMYSYEDLLEYPPEDGRICIDASGRNFSSKVPVYISYSLLTQQVKIRLSDVSTLDSTP